MKTLVAAFFAAGMSLTAFSSAQAITVTAAPLAEAVQDMSSVVEVQACGRGLQLTPQGCRAIQYGYKSGHKSKKKKKTKAKE